MPPVRSKSQKSVLLWLDENFLSEIDRAFPLLGYSDRSTFIREAVYEALEEHGIKLPAAFKAAPSRAGKGGRKKITNHGILVEGNVQTVTQHLSTLPSAVSPRRVAKTAKAGKKPRNLRTKK